MRIHGTSVDKAGYLAGEILVSVRDLNDCGRVTSVDDTLEIVGGAKCHIYCCVWDISIVDQQPHRGRVH